MVHSRSNERQTTPAAAEGRSAAGVCLQTMWRSCGTYVFNKLRKETVFHAYFEPCSEWLLGTTPEAINAAFDRQVRMDLRHDGRQSFAEFPFSASGGVEGFNRRFPFDDFYLPRDAHDRELEEYLRRLVAHAEAAHRIPAFKCCRFGLRAQWMNRVLALATIYVVRDPDAMFRSYWSFGGKRSYFLLASLLVLTKNQHLPPFQELASDLSLPRISATTVYEELVASYELALTLEPQDFRDIVLLLWVTTTVHNWRAADVILDVDLLAADSAYRSDAADRVAALVGRPIAFADAQQRQMPVAPGEVVSARGAACAANAVRLIEPEWTPSLLQLSPQSERALDCAI